MITKDSVIEVLQTVQDPEIHMDVWTMGLIYNLEVDVKKKEVTILMTYTTPFCPWGPQLNTDITNALTKKLKVKKVDIELTFDPPYKMPDELRATLEI